MEEYTAMRVAAVTTASPGDDARAAADAKAEPDLLVRADKPAEVGLFEGIIDTVIGFLFG
jgi:hypothetical protein